MPDTLFCPLRKRWVAALPEEKIRQGLIQKMTQRLGYPLASLALEKNLSQLPHLKDKTSLPRRRADLIVFAKDLHPQHSLYPLLLVECKAVPFTRTVLRQIVGYNRFVGAYFIAAVNQTNTLLGLYHPQYQEFLFREGLLSHDLLLEQARILNTTNSPNDKIKIDL
jgi:Type I restriction enzyme R protein N terminus (HSDR_N)